MASAQYDQSSVDQDVMWLRLVSFSLCLFEAGRVFLSMQSLFVFALTSFFLLYCVSEGGIIFVISLSCD